MTKTHKPLTERQLAELREAIRTDSHRIGEISEQQRGLRARLSELAAELRETTSRRDANLTKGRRNGVDVVDLADDTGLTAGRIRQIAPGEPGRPRGRRPGPTPARAPRAEVTMTVDDDDQADDDACRVYDIEGGPVVVRGAAPLSEEGQRAMAEVITAARAKFAAEHPEPAAGWIAPPAPNLSGIAAAVDALPPSSVRPAVPARKRLPKVVGRYAVDERVEQALREAAGDIDAARDLLIGSAVDDAMTLLDACRAGAVYDYTAHPSLPAPLQRAGRKKSDMIWEGRPHWRNPETPAGTRIDVLDTNAAYLASLRRTHLPIGKLVQDTDPSVYNPRRAGIYLIDPPQWNPPNVPNPLGNGRTENGPVWVTTPTLRLLHRAYGPDIRVPILDSWTSGASENLLTKFGDTLSGYRAQALQDDDSLTLEYVKSMYSKFVSTAGDSAANHDIRRPEWVHAMRSQAFANLWLRGARAATCGLLVHAIVGTDELHVAGDWRSATYKGAPAFREGRGLPEIKHKRSYVVGDRDQEVSGDA